MVQSVRASQLRAFDLRGLESEKFGADGELGASRRGATWRTIVDAGQKLFHAPACLLSTPSSRFGLMPRKVSFAAHCPHCPGHQTCPDLSRALMSQ